MADMINPRPHQYVENWPDWSSSAPAAHGRQRPTSMRFRQKTNEQTNRRTNEQRDVIIDSDIVSRA